MIYNRRHRQIASLHYECSDVSKEHTCSRTNYYKHHNDTGLRRCVSADVSSDCTYCWMTYYTYHRYTDAPHCACGDVPKDPSCQWKIFTYVTGIWMLPAYVLSEQPYKWMNYHIRHSNIGAPQYEFTDVLSSSLTNDHPVTHIAGTWTLTAMSALMCLQVTLATK